MENEGVYYSRGYLREKYISFKNDMENFLHVLDEDYFDQISEEDMVRVQYNLLDKMKAMEFEILKGGILNE